MLDSPELPPLTDTHCHLNHPRLLRRLPEVLDHARRARVTRMLVVGYDVPSSEQAIALAADYPQLTASVGLHPHDASDLTPDLLDRLRSLARSDRVVAIGETGLDYYRDLSHRDLQQTAFRHHLDLARDLDLPLIVHCREAQDDLLAALREVAPPGPVIWHSFDGTLDHARAALDLGLFLGFNGLITRRSADSLRTVAAALPTDRLLLETDAPYLAPDPRRSHDNEPSNLPVILAALSSAVNTDPTALARTTTATAASVFPLPD